MMDELLGYPTEYRPDRISIDLTEHQLSLDKKVVDEAKYYGLRADLLNPQEVRELVPLAGDNV
jgi:sarcosine oxidase subunit beta